MLKPSRLPAIDPAATFQPRGCDGRNPFFIGTFEGEASRRAREGRTFWLVAALTVATGFAGGFLAGNMGDRLPDCRLIAVGPAGDAYVVGAGDTPRDALRGVTFPHDWQAAHWEGCAR
jgi:hypothetical protein